MIISSNLLSIDMEIFTLKAKFPNWKHDFFFDERQRRLLLIVVPQ